jgi:hypothetical protein
MNLLRYNRIDDSKGSDERVGVPMRLDRRNPLKASRRLLVPAPLLAVRR